MPRSHELGDADAEGADTFPVQINNDFLGDCSTLAVLNPDLSATPRSLSSRSPAKASSPKACRTVHYPEGSAVTGTLAGSDGSEVDRPGRTGGSRDGTSGAVRSSGADRTTEQSVDVFASLLSADDPLMQQIGSLLSAQ